VPEELNCEAGINAPILILGATHIPEQIQAIALATTADLVQPEAAVVFSNARTTTFGGSIPVHIKIDTRMSRLGPLWQEAAEFVQMVQRLPNLHIASIYSHLAAASLDQTVMRQQQARFEQS